MMMKGRWPHTEKSVHYTVNWRRRAFIGGTAGGVSVSADLSIEGGAPFDERRRPGRALL